MALEGFDPEVEWIVLDLLPERGPFRGREGVRRFWELWSETFSLFRIEIKDVTGAGQNVIVTMRVSGTGRDSGAQVITPWFPQAWSARDGKFVRVEMFTSREEALESVGLPAGTPATPVEPPPA